jgi:homoserine O-acetyltransferase
MMGGGGSKDSSASLQFCSNYSRQITRRILNSLRWLVQATAIVAFLFIARPALAADYPVPKEGDWVARDFRFHTGETVPELRLHYTTVGASSGQPVLILHGTTGSGTGMLSPEFAGELFGPGQPLDASKYYIILPDSIGHGESAKPSDGLRAKFPTYNYDDMVEAEYRLVTEGLGVHHLRLVLGFSMGGMHTWMWGEKYPDLMDALVPMASEPTKRSSRNWTMRRLILRLAALFKADHEVDVLYARDSSRDYDPAPGLERIKAPLLAINSADDQSNPSDTGIMERELKRVSSGRLFLIPGSIDTYGHGTASFAKFWKRQLQELLDTVPERTLP